MSTVIPNDAAKLEESSSIHPAPKKILKVTYESVLGAIQSNKKIILITGDAKKGKSALIHTISKDISTKNRVISLSGKDLPKLDPSSSNNDSGLDQMKDFIIESTELEDNLVVTLDDAHCLPIKLLAELIEHANNSSPENHNLQILLSGPITLKEQLLEIEEIGEEDLTHYPLDSLSESAIHTFAKDKTYKISSNIKRLEFKQEALHTLSEFIQNDRQLLDVVLEWCAALAKKDQLTSITSHTVSRAAGFAQQFSKDKQLRLSNSYPPSHEVYKYINDIQSSKKIKRASTAKTNSKAAKRQKQNKNTKPFAKPFIETKSKETASQETKIPTITSKVERTKTSPADVEQADEVILQSLHEIEDEIVPIQRTPAPKRAATNKKSFPTMAGLIGILLLGFVSFIAFRIGSDPVTDTKADKLPDEKIAAVETQENLIENQPKLITAKPVKEKKPDDVITTTPIEPKVTNNKVPEIATKVPHGGIVASDNKKSVEPNLEAEEPALTPKGKINDSKIIADKNTANEIIKKPETKVSVADTKLNENIAETKPKNNTKVTTQKPQKTVTKPSPEIEINNLLVLANYQFENKQLSTPPGDNALETYQNILVKHPNNKSAAEGVKKVHDKYIAWANYYLQQNDIKRAKHFYNKALTIEPKDAVAIANLKNIARQEAVAEKAKAAGSSSSIVLQDAIPASVIENLMVSATKKMQQIENDIKTNKRNYKIYQEAQAAYQDVLKSQPQNQDASQGLSLLRRYYSEWAELQIQSQNYNIALFLYGQALSIEPGNTKISKRIEQIRELKQAAL